MTAIPPAAQASIADAMARMWAKFLPEIERRLSVLEIATAALDNGTLTIDQRESAHADAHKLAGSLGTFGLHRGTEVARQAECLLASELDGASKTKLASLVNELRSLIDSKQ